MEEAKKRFIDDLSNEEFRIFFYRHFFKLSFEEMGRRLKKDRKRLKRICDSLCIAYECEQTKDLIIEAAHHTDLL